MKNSSCPLIGISFKFRPEDSSFKILSFETKDYMGYYVCECALCKKEILVVEDPLGYHFPTYQWPTTCLSDGNGK